MHIYDKSSKCFPQKDKQSRGANCLMSKLTQGPVLHFYQCIIDTVTKYCQQVLGAGSEWCFPTILISYFLIVVHFLSWGVFKARRCNCQKDSQKPTVAKCAYADKFTQTSWRRSSVSKTCDFLSFIPLSYS